MSDLAFFPDLTRPDLDQRICGEEHGGYHCTRRIGHTGRHAAGTGYRIVAVWPERDA